MAKEVVNQYLDLHFDHESLVANYQFGYLRRIIEACFLVDDSPKNILQCLFSRIVPGFSFPDIASKKEEHAFYNKLLFSLYAQDFPLLCCSDATTLSHYFFQLLASCVSTTRLKALFKGLQPQEQKNQLAFSAAHFDEGAFAIFAAAKKLGAVGSVTSWEKKKLLELLQPYTKKRLTLPAIERFLKVFGLYGHQLPVSLHSFEEGTSLIEKLEAISFHEEAPIFVDRILLHIQALSEHPEWYQEGLQSLIHALPTCGKDLSKLFWLESTAASVQMLGRYIDVSKHSILVFDQSEPTLFAKNAVYIAKLAKRYKVAIKHIDTPAILEAASKLNVEHFLRATPTAQFGYGGARNIVFLLAPYFCKANGDKPFIHMGDDDVYVHPSLIFSDALWAYLHKDEYCCRMGYVMGRFARDSNFTKHDLLYATSSILSQCPWIASPYPHAMAGLVSKPKVGLALPFGQEENHMRAIRTDYFDFRLPAIHLAGPRYPAYKGWPTRIFCGLGEFLRQRYVDVFQRLLVTELLDPINRYNQCALPWNLKTEPFTSFEEMLKFMESPTTKALMQERFWSNFSRAACAFSELPASEYIHSSQAINEIIQTNWDQEFLDIKPVKEAKSLRAFYKEFAIQAAHYKAFLLAIHHRGTTKEVIESVKAQLEPIEDKPLAYSLYLFCKVVGT